MLVVVAGDIVSMPYFVCFMNLPPNDAKHVFMPSFSVGNGSCPNVSNNQGAYKLNGDNGDGVLSCHCPLIYPQRQVHSPKI